MTSFIFMLVLVADPDWKTSTGNWSANSPSEIFRAISFIAAAFSEGNRSNSELAEDIKLLIREKIVEGESDDEIKQFLVEKYGEWVLMTPRFNQYTYLLWGTPLIIFILGFWLISKKVKKFRED